MQAPILIVGPGAVGAALAARWAWAGTPVLALGRDAASETRLARGLLFTGLDGRTRRLRLPSARAAGKSPCRAAFFTVKAGDLARAAAAARPWIGPETPVVGLLNGVGHERALRRAFGPRRVVLGSCYFGADRPGPGRVSHTWGERVVLAASRENRAAAGEARRLLAGAGWKTALAGSEEALLWTKLCFNAAINPIGAVCGVPNGRLAEDPALRELTLDALREAAAAARKDGRRLLPGDLEALVVRSCREAPAQRNSMLQDLAAGRRTEIREITGPLLAAARRAKSPAPILTRLSRLVLRLERLLGASPPHRASMGYRRPA